MRTCIGKPDHCRFWARVTPSSTPHATNSPHPPFACATPAEPWKARKKFYHLSAFSIPLTTSIVPTLTVQTRFSKSITCSL